MRALRMGLLVGLVLALSACGKQESASARFAARTSDPSPRPAAAAAKNAAAQQKSAEQGSDQPSKITRINEDGSETVEEVTGDSGARNRLLAAVASTVAAGTATAAAATPGVAIAWQDGVNYTRLVPAQPTAVAAGQVEVLEFFWYACPHCFAMDPMIETWNKAKPAYVTFSRVPVMWNDGHRSLARLYYTLQTLGKLDQLHSEIFKEIHTNGDPLIGRDPPNDVESERVQTTFVKKFGISEDAFKTTYHSFPVDTALTKADQLVQRYRVDTVPRFVVNGKYVTDAGMAGSPERMMSLISDLTAQEHKR